MSESTHGFTVRGSQYDGESFTAEALGVTDGGRVRIPSRLREAYGVGEGDIIHLEITTPEWVFTILDQRVDSKGRVRIPVGRRDLYDIEDGDIVTVEVTVSGLEVE